MLRNTQLTHIQLAGARRVIPVEGKAYQSKPLLTKREREVFELLVQDKTTKEIAGELFISEKTVRNHISNAMQELRVRLHKQLSSFFVWESSNYKKAADFYTRKVGYFSVCFMFPYE